MNATLDQPVLEIELDTENGLSELAEFPTMPELQELRKATEALSALSEIESRVLARNFPGSPLNLPEDSSNIAIHPSAEKNILDTSLRQLRHKNKT